MWLVPAASVRMRVLPWRLVPMEVPPLNAEGAFTSQIVSQLLFVIDVFPAVPTEACVSNTCEPLAVAVIVPLCPFVLLTSAAKFVAVALAVVPTLNCWLEADAPEALIVYVLEVVAASIKVIVASAWSSNSVSPKVNVAVAATEAVPSWVRTAVAAVAEPTLPTVLRVPAPVAPKVVVTVPSEPEVLPDTERTS